MTTMHDISLVVNPERLAVCRLPAEADPPDWARPGELLAFLHTRRELSVVCAERFVPPEIKAERGWRMLEVQGPLDFTLVGVLAAISAPLARAGISIFVLSTFDTDLILVKDEAIEKAIQALVQANFQVIKDARLSA